MWKTSSSDRSARKEVQYTRKKPEKGPKTAVFGPVCKADRCRSVATGARNQTKCAGAFLRPNHGDSPRPGGRNDWIRPLPCKNSHKSAISRFDGSCSTPSRHYTQRRTRERWGCNVTLPNTLQMHTNKVCLKFALGNNVSRPRKRGREAPVFCVTGTEPHILRQIFSRRPVWARDPP